MPFAELAARPSEVMLQIGRGFLGRRCANAGAAGPALGAVLEEQLVQAGGRVVGDAGQLGDLSGLALVAAAGGATAYFCAHGARAGMIAGWSATYARKRSAYSPSRAVFGSRRRSIRPRCSRR